MLMILRSIVFSPWLLAIRRVNRWSTYTSFVQKIICSNFVLDSKEKQQIIDLSPIKIPTCLRLRDSFEQVINQSSDPLLSTAPVPKHSSISLETETSLSQDEELSFFKHNILRQQTSLRDKANLDRSSNTFIVLNWYF